LETPNSTVIARQSIGSGGARACDTVQKVQRPWRSSRAASPRAFISVGVEAAPRMPAAWDTSACSPAHQWRFWAIGNMGLGGGRMEQGAGISGSRRELGARRRWRRAGCWWTECAAAGGRWLTGVDRGGLGG
jgi:hypothetical protein